MKYESIIFDIDGTLWDSREMIAEGWNICLRKEGLDHLCVTAEDLTALFGKVANDIADVLFASIPRPDRYDLMRRCTADETRYMENDPCRIGYPGVRETIEALAKNHRIFIVSNSDSGYPQLCINKLDLSPFVSGHLCHGDTGVSKGQTLRILMERHNITDCVYIGDTHGDELACREAGIPFIYAAYGLGQAESWDAQIHSIDELLRM